MFTIANVISHLLPANGSYDLPLKSTSYSVNTSPFVFLGHKLSVWFWNCCCYVLKKLRHEVFHICFRYMAAILTSGRDTVINCWLVDCYILLKCLLPSYDFVLSITLPDETGSHKSLMAARTMYLHASQLVYMIATNFQRLSLVFERRQYGQPSGNVVRRMGMSEIKYVAH